MHAESIQSCLTLCDPMDCSPPVSFVHGSLQARIPEWVAMSSSRGSSRPRDWTRTSHFSCIAGRFVTTEPPGKLLFLDWGHFWGAFLPVACNSANGPFIKMPSDYPVWVWPLISVRVRLTLALWWSWQGKLKPICEARGQWGDGGGGWYKHVWSFVPRT